MLEYDRIDVSAGIDVNETDALKECDIFHYWYLKDTDFKYKPNLCNACHNSMPEAINFIGIAIFSIKGSEYRIHFWYMSKNNAINIMKSSSLNEKSGSL